MATSDRVRLSIRSKLEPLIGAEEADAMADALLHPEWQNLATKDDVRNLGVEMRGEMTLLRSELRSEMATLQANMTRDFHAALWASQGASAAVIALVVALAVLFG